ncbi:hypothetical protein TNCV_2627121 [Trichonephila clavipes]|uniref:Uncharacterized protein n=1 Tax=Trichonephila clavipes TaxID=2585209 RepID=A0A8X6W747_TRICX|nr:hypothetical protein TNCV_2627121 [Trichonephila clavipes]
MSSACILRYNVKDACTSKISIPSTKTPNKQTGNNKKGTTKREQEMIPQEIRPDAPNDVEFDYPCQSLLDRRSLAVNEASCHWGRIELLPSL